MERRGYQLLCTGFLLLVALSLGTILAWEFAIRVVLLNPPLWSGTALAPMTPGGVGQINYLTWDPKQPKMSYHIETTTLNPQQGVMTPRTAVVCVDIPAVYMEWQIQVGVRPGTVRKYPPQTFNTSSCATVVVCTSPSPTIYLSIQVDDPSGAFPFTISSYNDVDEAETCVYGQAIIPLLHIGWVVVSVCIVVAWISGMCAMCMCYWALASDEKKPAEKQGLLQVLEH